MTTLRHLDREYGFGARRDQLLFPSAVLAVRESCLNLLAMRWSLRQIETATAKEI